MKHSLPMRVLVVLIALTLGACGGDTARRGEHQQVAGRPLPKYHQASLPAGLYHTTEFEPSLTLRIPGDDWRFEGPSGTLDDPERPDYLFLGKVEFGEIAFFNLRKLEGVYKPKGLRGEIAPMPAPDEMVGWFHHHPYLKASDPEPATVGGVEGVQFDVLLVNMPKNHKGVCGDGPGCLDTFALSTGGSSEVFHLKREHYIVLKDVKGVPVVIYYNNLKDEFDEFEPVARKVLDSVEWTES